MNIDMHFHSNISDGKNNHSEHIKSASKNELDFIAMTDHDKVSPSLFKKQCSDSGIYTCDSVEISARNTRLNKSLHLTLYARQISYKTKEILSNTISKKILLIKKQIEFLNQKGFTLNYDDFLKYSLKNGRKIDALNKFDIATYVYHIEHNRKFVLYLNGGIELNMIDFYSRFLKRDGDMYSEYGYEIEEYEPNLETCKQIQRECNGILSIAHPNMTFKGGISEFNSSLREYVEKGGVNAIEINSKATKEWIQAILEAREKYNLYVTFGSDNHNIGYTDEKHGDYGELNPYISKKQVSELFNEYSHMIIGN
ncbi:hypothetical protein EOM39_05050 [Candidatus Gracilibacteria bacterium]|nr:hypothetical protein [Candidatus Gracilibacteria bacterium]